MSARIVDLEGEPLLLSIAKNISDRYQWQLELAESEARFREMANSAPVLIWLAGPDGLCTWFSQVWLDWTGRSMEEERLDGWSRHVHPDDLAAGLDHYQKSLDARQPFEVEYRLRHHSGAYRWLHGRGSPRFDQEGTFLGYIGACTDIQDRKEAERAMQEWSQSLELRVSAEVATRLAREQMLINQSRLAVVGEMVGNIAHQWRQPLSSIAMLLADLKDARQHGELTDASFDSAMRLGHELLQKMSSTISDFLGFFRPEKAPSPFPLRQKTQETLQLLESTLRQRKVTVRVQDGPEVLMLGYANEFSQVLMNLLSNAADAIEAAGVPAGRIEIEITRGPAEARLRFTDNGGGIQVQPLEQIFEAYCTTKPAGTGLGLYMSRMILEQSLRGTLEARNVPGGAEFLIRVPLPEDPQP